MITAEISTKFCSTKTSEVGYSSRVVYRRQSLLSTIALFIFLINMEKWEYDNPLQKVGHVRWACALSFYAYAAAVVWCASVQLTMEERAIAKKGR